jgi:hypothetical protein
MATGQQRANIMPHQEVLEELFTGPWPWSPRALWSLGGDLGGSCGGVSSRSRGAEATPWAAAREVLQTAQLSWVTTVRADGRPHVTPLVAVWLDDAGTSPPAWANRRP